jgi:soluble P-type ATPase
MKNIEKEFKFYKEKYLKNLHSEIKFCPMVGILEYITYKIIIRELRNKDSEELIITQIINDKLFVKNENQQLVFEMKNDEHKKIYKLVEKEFNKIFKH